MPFQSTISRVAAVAAVLLSIGFLVHASPIAAPAPSKELISIEARGKHCFGDTCFGGLDLLLLLQTLKAVIEAKLILLDACFGGGDYAAIIYEIEGLLLAACSAIKVLDIGIGRGLLGSLFAIAQILVAIIVSLIAHLHKWHNHADFAIFVLLIAKIDLALKLICSLILGLAGGVLGGVLGLVVGRLTPTHIGHLNDLNFYESLGVLGL